MVCKMNSKWRFWAWVGVLGVAFAVRWLAAREAYPVPGDGGHFVQWGVAMAHGHAKLNTYWSQGMVLAAAGAERLGLDPKRTLQGISFVAGMLVVLLFGGITGRVTKSGGWGLAGGLWAATNLTMVQYSIEGYSEMAYMAFLMGVVYIAVGGKPGRKRDLAAGVLLGLGGWFKGLDAAVAACAFALWRWVWGGRRRWDWQLAAVAPLVAFVVLLPLCAYTYSETGQFTPGSKGGAAILWGDDWKDSKLMYSTEQYVHRSYGEAIKALPRQIAANAHESFQTFNAQLFARGYRLGTVWFCMLVVLAAWTIGTRRDSMEGKAFLPFSILAVQVAMLCLSLVHDRVLAPSLPWVVLALLLGFREWMGDCGRGGRWVATGVLAIYFAGCLAYSRHAFRTEFAWWRYGRVERVAEELRSLGMQETDTVMEYGPQLAIETHREDPLLTVEVPYGSVEDVGRTTREKGVRFVAVSDHWRGHWPVARVAAGVVEPPIDWTLRKELAFPGDEETGTPAEHIRVYEVEEGLPDEIAG